MMRMERSVGGIDQDGNIRAEQVIFAKVPEHGNLGNVSEGTWVYYITPDHLSGYTLPKSVRAELYRVNNAETNEGERLVSNTVPLTVPGQLPQISLKADSRTDIQTISIEGANNRHKERKKQQEI